jgi:hypothetical protein
MHQWDRRRAGPPEFTRGQQGRRPHDTLCSSVSVWVARPEQDAKGVARVGSSRTPFEDSGRATQPEILTVTGHYSWTFFTSFFNSGSCLLLASSESGLPSR